MQTILTLLKVSPVKVKESRNKPGVAQRVPGGLGSQISWHSAREGGDVSLTHRPPLPPRMFLVLTVTRGWVDPRAMVRSEGGMSLKNSVTPPGIDPGTVRLVAQCLNHYATPGHSMPRRILKLSSCVWILECKPFIAACTSLETMETNISACSGNGWITAIWSLSSPNRFPILNSF